MNSAVVVASQHAGEGQLQPTVLVVRLGGGPRPEPVDGSSPPTAGTPPSRRGRQWLRPAGVRRGTAPCTPPPSGSGGPPGQLRKGRGDAAGLTSGVARESRLLDRRPRPCAAVATHTTICATPNPTANNKPTATRPRGVEGEDRRSSAARRTGPRRRRRRSTARPACRRRKRPS